jgi:hypothetical protein
MSASSNAPRMSSRRDGTTSCTERNRCFALLSSLGGNQPEEAVEASKRDVLDFGRGELSDDVAVLAIRRGRTRHVANGGDANRDGKRGDPS